jgi:hypothetical protein
MQQRRRSLKLGLMWVFLPRHLPMILQRSKWKPHWFCQKPQGPIRHPNPTQRHNWHSSKRWVWKLI